MFYVFPVDPFVLRVSCGTVCSTCFLWIRVFYVFPVEPCVLRVLFSELSSEFSETRAIEGICYSRRYCIKKVSIVNTSGQTSRHA